MKSIIFILILIPTLTFSQNNSTWDFPVKPGSEEWKNFATSSEMVDACQIPQDILKTLSTEELLVVCLKYPMFFDIHFANNFQDGMDFICSSFNGLSELLERDDCTKCLIKEYSKITPSDLSVKKESNKYKLFYLELLLTRKNVYQSLSIKENETLLKESLKKIKLKKEKNILHIILIHLHWF